MPVLIDKDGKPYPLTTATFAEAAAANAKLGLLKATKHYAGHAVGIGEITEQQALELRASAAVNYLAPLTNPTGH